MKNSLFKRAMATVAAVPLALTQCLTFTPSYAVTDEAQPLASDSDFSTESGVTSYTLKGEGGLLYIAPDKIESTWYDLVNAELVLMGQKNTTGYIKKETITNIILSRAGNYADKIEPVLDILSDEDIVYTVTGNGDIKITGKIVNPDYSKFIGTIDIPVVKALEEIADKYGIPEDELNDKLMNMPIKEGLKELVDKYEIDIDEVAETLGMSLEELAEKYGVSKEEISEIQEELNSQSNAPALQSAPNVRAGGESTSGIGAIDFSSVDISGTYEITIGTSKLSDNQGKADIKVKYIANNGGKKEEIAVGDLPQFAIEKLEQLRSVAHDAINDAVSDKEIADDTIASIDSQFNRYIKWITKADNNKDRVKTVNRSVSAANVAEAIQKANDFADGNKYVGKVDSLLNHEYRIPATVADIMKNSIVASIYDSAINQINSRLVSYDFDIKSSDVAAFADNDLYNINASAESGTYILKGDFPDDEVADSTKHIEASVVVGDMYSTSDAVATVGLRIWRDTIVTTTTTTDSETTSTTTTVASTDEKVDDSTSTTTGSDVDVDSTSTTTSGDVDVDSTSTTTSGDVDVDSTSTTTSGDVDVDSTSTTTSGDVDVDSTSTTTSGDVDVDSTSTTTTDNGGDDVDGTSTTTTDNGGDDVDGTTTTTTDNGGDDNTTTTTTTTDNGGDDNTTTTTTTTDNGGDDNTTTTTTTTDNGGDDNTTTTTTTDNGGDDNTTTTTTTTDNGGDDNTTTTTTTMSGYLRSYVEYDTTTATDGFYFSHDDGTYGGFHAEQLDLGSIKIYDVYDNDGEEVTIEKENIDVSEFNFNGETPATVYSVSNTTFRYNVQLYYGDIALVDKGGYPIAITAYIGVKGDVNFDNKANSVDASQILSYYAELSTDGSATTSVLSLSDKVNYNATSIYDNFAAFLGDVNKDEFSAENWQTGKAGRELNSVDASQILLYYSLVSAEYEGKAQEAWDIASPSRRSE